MPGRGLSGADRRVLPRERSFARILITLNGKAGYIADISPGGYRGLFPEPLLLEPGRVYEVEASFEELGLAAFSLPSVLRWTRGSEGAFEAGFELGAEVGRAGMEAFGRIRAYYASHSGADPRPDET